LPRKFEIHPSGGFEVDTFTRRNVIAFTLRKTIDENSPISRAKGEDHAKTARLATTSSSNSLFEQSAAEICVDETSFDFLDRVDESGVSNFYLPAETTERFRDKYPQSHTRNSEALNHS
jgi:Asp-tRNA(Asn)/Glu-tRNA(Gln) amidotransferase C subunit